MNNGSDEMIRVLHVDDEPDSAELTATHLERVDDRFSVETATGPAEGLDRLSERIDCVVSDYEMPEMDGLEFLGAVREQYPELPSVLFTNEGDEDIASAAISAGVTDYFRKSSSMEQYELLANRVRNAVEQARARERADERERVVGEMNELAVIVQDGTIRYTSPGVSELLGYPEDHPIGREMTAFVAPDSRDTLRERHQRWMEGDTTERPNQHELSLLSADGERVPVEVSVSRIEYRGRPATLSIVRDTTERRHQQQRFQAFIEHSTDIITVLDADGTYKYQSPSSKRVLGYEPEEMVGDNAFDYVHPDDRDDIVERFGEAVSDPEMTPVVEYRLRHENGSWRWMESVGNNQLDNPAIEGFVVNSRDITDRKQKEQALQRQNERLERFASVVSHDLRNPLSVAEGHLELLSERCDSDRIDSIEQAHERMRQLIDDILSLAREGEPISDTESAHLPTVAERSWQGVSTSDATLSVETDLSVLADRSRLTQLFENLFRNAIEHGGEDVTVTVTDHQARGGFTVADDGTGIPEESRETIFEPGFSTTDDGTGFGLPIVREIAEAHGWEVEITESDTGGARFEVVGVDLVDR